MDVNTAIWRGARRGALVAGFGLMAAAVVIPSLPVDGLDLGGAAWAAAGGSAGGASGGSGGRGGTAGGVGGGSAGSGGASAGGVGGAHGGGIGGGASGGSAGGSHGGHGGGAAGGLAGSAKSGGGTAGTIGLGSLSPATDFGARGPRLTRDAERALLGAGWARGGRTASTTGGFAGMGGARGGDTGAGGGDNGGGDNGGGNNGTDASPAANTAMADARSRAPQCDEPGAFSGACPAPAVAVADNQETAEPATPSFSVDVSPLSAPADAQQ